ncbi:TniQ family protein [Pseudoalteromonas ostreae]|uniref:TniQ family protein n=1 Tax=Pseudoalteromonas ostreae TaxID=2774154 RepID=UPI001B3803CC|nr:TniQ family protein [Pseudoalteromonas ostreae]
MSSPLPVHPQPLPDELFSSWVYRVARSNGQNVFSFCHLLLPELNGRYYDIDNSVNSEAIRTLSLLLRTPYQRAWNTSLDSYAGLLYSAPTPKAKRKTCILQTGVTKNSDKRFCLQYCPICLAEQEPYYKKTWRISFITVCTKHACKLHDRCPQCLKPVKPLLNDIGQPHKMPFLGDITQCYHCGCQLTEAPIIKAKKDVVIDTLFYTAILSAGYLQLAFSLEWIYSFSIFLVLRHLLRVVAQKNYKSEITTSSIDPDIMDHQVRYRCMCKLAGLFRDWPLNFLDILQSLEIKYSELTSITKQKNPLPFWLDKEIKPLIFSPNSGPSEESVATAIMCMQASGKKLSILQLNKFMGYADSMSVKNVFKQQIAKYNRNF